MTPEEIEEVRATLKEARDCIEDLGSGKGGWAWEEVLDRIERAVITLSDTSHVPNTQGE
jgi:hypothetical protein